MPVGVNGFAHPYCKCQMLERAWLWGNGGKVERKMYRAIVLHKLLGAQIVRCEVVLEADMIVMFKRLLDGHINMLRIEGYG